MPTAGPRYAAEALCAHAHRSAQLTSSSNGWPKAGKATDAWPRSSLSSSSGIQLSGVTQLQCIIRPQRRGLPQLRWDGAVKAAWPCHRTCPPHSLHLPALHPAGLRACPCPARQKAARQALQHLASQVFVGWSLILPAHGQASSPVERSPLHQDKPVQSW